MIIGGLLISLFNRPVLVSDLSQQLFHLTFDTRNLLEPDAMYLVCCQIRRCRLAETGRVGRMAVRQLGEAGVIRRRLQLFLQQADCSPQSRNDEISDQLGGRHSELLLVRFRDRRDLFDPLGVLLDQNILVRFRRCKTTDLIDRRCQDEARRHNALCRGRACFDDRLVDPNRELKKPAEVILNISGIPRRMNVCQKLHGCSREAGYALIEYINVTTKTLFANNRVQLPFQHARGNRLCFGKPLAVEPFQFRQASTSAFNPLFSRLRIARSEFSLETILSVAREILASRCQLRIGTDPFGRKLFEEGIDIRLGRRHARNTEKWNDQQEASKHKR